MSTKNGRAFCDYCHIAFGDVEERVTIESAAFHEDCDRRRTRNLALREFFRSDRGQIPIRVVPRPIMMRR